MKRYFYQLLFCCLIALSGCVHKPETIVSSPDGKIKVQAGSENGRIYYTASRSGKPIFNKSFLGFELKEGDFSKNLRITEVATDSLKETWEQVWGEEHVVLNHYREMRLTIQEKTRQSRKFQVVFRVFNDGFGFRYEFPEQESMGSIVIMDELTQFNLAGNYTTWSLPWKTAFYEGLYKKSSVFGLDTVCTPLTLQTGDSLFLTIHEANLSDYASLNLYADGDSTVLRTWLTPWSSGEKVFMKTGGTTPWRTVIVAESAGDLMLSRLMLNLSETSRISDTSWIIPGKYIGIWWGMHMKKYTWEPGANHGATTENTIRYIDFAAKHGFRGVLVEGWNKGWEDWKSFELTTPYPDFDIAKIIDYAAAKNIKLIGHHETGANTQNYERQMEDAFAWYQNYGVNMVKTGYVGGKLDNREMHGSQYGVRHYRKVIETAAKHRIMIDNHEPAMPTGLQRTFPNLMTQEGVRGQEWNAWSADGGNPPDHTTTFPFTRGLAGPTDFTPVIFNFENTALPGTRVHTTLAKQLALFVVVYSPLQMAADMIENYEANPEPFEFIEKCPVNWEKTLIPHAKIGKYLTVARKDCDSENWYLGSITNEEARNLTVRLDFLDSNATYTAKVFADGNDADYKNNPYPVNIYETEVTANDSLELHLSR
ncbi:MAG: glycoside hydrolase family 97 protein, partial [Prolixibacteraceae bacterium]